MYRLRVADLVHFLKGITSDHLILSRAKMAPQLKLPLSAKMAPWCILVLSKMAPQCILAVSKMAPWCN